MRVGSGSVDAVLGALVVAQPEVAAARLVELVRQEGSLVAVARRLGANPRTVRRWASKLRAAGHEIPVRMGRPVAAA